MKRDCCSPSFIESPRSLKIRGLSRFMEVTMRADTDQDTIAAVSTAVSESGIGIIRVSGPEAFLVADRIFRSRKGKVPSSLPSHTIHYGFIYDGEEEIDEVLLSVFRKPHSYTAEDTVEINCHGGVYAMRRVLETALSHGARAAEPGEFTKRAFLNGRLDLSQAEAVMGIIRSKNEYALRNSLGQLHGSVLKTVTDLRGEILHEAAFIEAALDDPEHYSLDSYSEEIREKNERWILRIEDLIQSSENGRIIQEGIRTVIIGRPNAGKSSLLNLFVGDERAIVTDIEGTTRDILTETVQIGGITLLLADTAGIRETGDKVEKIGVDRAVKYTQEADLVLCVIDASEKINENDRRILSLCRNKKTIILLNKTDLSVITDEKMIADTLAEIMPEADTSENIRILPISAMSGEGLKEFEKTVRDMFYLGKLQYNDEVMITNVRQKNLLRDAKNSLLLVRKSIEDEMPEDFLSIDLRECCIALGKITGEETDEDLVNEIFRSFCMGK